jgi:hypothetical protein
MGIAGAVFKRNALLRPEKPQQDVEKRLSIPFLEAHRPCARPSRSEAAQIRSRRICQRRSPKSYEDMGVVFAALPQINRYGKHIST